MGTNKRYAAAIDRAAHEKQVERAFENERPHSLSAFELELDEYPLTTTRSPKPCWAWVSYPSVVTKVPARMIEWTPRAVKVTWQVGPGRLHEAWVWASACSDRVAPPLPRSSIS